MTADQNRDREQVRPEVVAMPEERGEPLRPDEIPDYEAKVKAYRRLAKERAAENEFHPIDELMVQVTHLTNRARVILKDWSGRRRNWSEDQRTVYLAEVARLEEELQAIRSLGQTAEGIDAELARIASGDGDA